MIRCISIILGLMAVSSLAQEVTVNTEILTIAIDEPLSGLYFQNGREIANFQANLTGLGEPLAYKGPRNLVLRASEAEFSAAPPLPAPVASVELPLNSDRVLLVCIKRSDQPPKFIAYDIAKGKSVAGDYRFFNFSHMPISAIFGSKRFAINPGGDSLQSDSNWKTEVSEIDMELAIIKDGKAKPVYTSAWGHRPGRRSFVFFFDGATTYKPLKICRFFDVPSQQTGEKNAP